MTISAFRIDRKSKPRECGGTERNQFSLTVIRRIDHNARHPTRRRTDMTNAIALDRPAPVTVSDIRALPTVNVDVAAAFLGISRNAAYAAVKAGEIKSLKLGRRVVIPVHP